MSVSIKPKILLYRLDIADKIIFVILFFDRRRLV